MQFWNWMIWVLLLQFCPSQPFVGLSLPPCCRAANFDYSLTHIDIIHTRYWIWWGRHWAYCTWWSHWQYLGCFWLSLQPLQLQPWGFGHWQDYEKKASTFQPLPEIWPFVQLAQPSRQAARIAPLDKETEWNAQVCWSPNRYPNTWNVLYEYIDIYLQRKYLTT